MNSVRDQMRNGVPEADAGDFRQTVRDAVRTVENICRSHKTTPDTLPAPSRRAYAYLRDLDLTNLPKPKATPIVTEGSIRVSGIVTVCNRYHARFSRQVQRETGPYTVEHHAVQTYAAAMESETAGIAAICRDSGGPPAALPVRSRRGYQWLSFLRDPARLSEHLSALASLYEISKGYKVPQERLKIQLMATSSLYRAKVSGVTRTVVIHEGFITAPQDILVALMALTLTAKAPDTSIDVQEEVRRYSQSSSYLSIRTALVSQTQSLAGSGKGQHHDLSVAFDRVNRAYFHNQMERPTLVWNQRHTHRKMGHYDAARDTILVSITLDAPDVPAYVIDFVVYHEMLHKHLGTYFANGRRHAHTPEFRKMERAFKDYARVQAFLKTWNAH